MRGGDSSPEMARRPARGAWLTPMGSAMTDAQDRIVWINEAEALVGR